MLGTATSGQAARTLGTEARLAESRTLASLLWRLDHGRIAARGTQAELLEASEVFREIHEHGLLQQVVAG